jgi:hypothetical protein
MYLRGQPQDTSAELNDGESKWQGENIEGLFHVDVVADVESIPACMFVYHINICMYQSAACAVYESMCLYVKECAGRGLCMYVCTGVLVCMQVRCMQTGCSFIK